jgi:hypothetical protein
MGKDNLAIGEAVSALQIFFSDGVFARVAASMLPPAGVDKLLVF